MTSLDSYLRGPYKEDGLFLNRLLNTIAEVVPAFYKQKLHLPVRQAGRSVATTWPYAISRAPNGRLVPSGERFSASTHCMILFALDAFAPRGKDKYSFLLGKGFQPCKLSVPTIKKDELWNVVAAATRDLLTVITGTARGKPIVQSRTYGNDDPFTLTWLTELAFRCRAEECQVPLTELAKASTLICKAADQALRRAQILDMRGAEGTFSEVTGSFLKVRRLHLAKAVERLAATAGLASIASAWFEEESPWKEFDTTIHRQLSYSAMGDPKFDPAELAFAFEGALLTQRFWVDRSTVDQVFEALKLSRDRQPFWRPITPFLTNDRGQVLFLVSVEVANSILRACEILDQDEAVPIRFSQIEPQLRTYATWLLGEVEQIPDPRPTAPNLVGWRTEYADKRGTVHFWHTSHVLLFLTHYESLLRRKIGADGVEAAGLHVRLPNAIPRYPDYWTDEPLPSLAATGNKHYAVLGRIESQYITPRETPEADRKVPQSMLLYGPPGTGKTTLAEQMATRLNRPLIVVTVSDFLAAGAPEIENRAKGVFQVLGSQEGVVVLFDEIDQFLLDRNSTFYQDQSDVFKFMTPGMLTKLQDLRDAEGCIFIVATNYYERVDGAIKRRGRIDDHLLLCIPDWTQRLSLLKRFVLNLFKRTLAEEKTRQAYARAAKSTSQRAFFAAVSRGTFRARAFETAAEQENIAAKTVHFGWGDLRHLVDAQTAIQPGMDMASLASALAAATDKVDSAVTLSAYRNRFEGTGPFPFEEFFLLLYLAAESRKELSTADKQTVVDVLKLIPEFTTDDPDYLLRERFIREKLVCETVCQHFKELLDERNGASLGP